MTRFGIDGQTFRGYKWLVKRTVRKAIHSWRGPITKNSSKLVVFRLDDVAFSYINSLIAIMDTFLKKNHNLSIGLVMNQIDRNSLLMEKITYGCNMGLFELALHGWDHADHSKLNEKEQKDLFCKALEKMQNLFGKSSKIFIPPYNKFNHSTLHAMNKEGIRIISSMLNYEDEKEIFKVGASTDVIADTSLIYHIPETASFEKWDRQGKPTRISIKQILNEIDLSISLYGYAIVTIHPVTFATSPNEKLNDTVDEEQLNDLISLIEYVESKNILITNFSKISEIN